MRSSTIVLAVGLLSAPLSFLAGRTPDAALPFDAFNPANVRPVQALVKPGFTDAPVSSIPPDGVSPVDRAAGAGTRSFDAGPVNSTPFSDTPTGTLSDGGTQVSRGDRTLAPSDGNGVTPNLGK